MSRAGHSRQALSRKEADFPLGYANLRPVRTKPLAKAASLQPLLYVDLHSERKRAESSAINWDSNAFGDSTLDSV